MYGKQKFYIPEKIEIETHTYSRYFGRFIARPFERGWATTIGNAYRRVLLSSIEGAAIVAVNINESLHEFASIPGVVEDVYEIILNLRHLPIKLFTDSMKRLRLQVNTIGPVYARQIEHDADVEILAPDHYICTIGDEGRIQIEMIVARGRGYVPAERNARPELPKGFIPVASIHSPVKKVAYKVEPERVGRLTEYERLTLEIWTNGTVTPVEALHQATEMILRHTNLFETLEEPEIKEDVAPPAEEEAHEAEEVQTKVALEDLGLRAGLTKILKEQGIETVADLITKTKADLLNLNRVGKKSVEEIIESLKKHNLTLRES